MFENQITGSAACSQIEITWLRAVEVGLLSDRAEKATIASCFKGD